MSSTVDASSTTESEEPADERTPNFGRDFLASIVVFLVALPLCMGIAIASGVPVAAGLITGIIGGIIVGSFAGSPLQVSGPAAGLAVIIFEFVNKTGLEYLGLAVLIGGVIQMVAGVAKIGQWFRAVSPAVIEGMLAGIGVLIFASQFHVMVDDSPKGSGLKNLITIPEAIVKGLPLPELKDAETRKAIAANLKAIGSVHETQVQVQERLAEHRLADAMESDFDKSQALRMQQMVNEKFAAVQEDLKTTTTFEGELGAKRQATFEETAKALQDALTAIEQEELDARRVFEAQEAAVTGTFAAEASLKNHDWAAKIGLLTIVVIIVWRLAPKKLQIIPPPLLAIIAATAVAAGLALPVLYVEVPDSLVTEIHVPTLALLQSANWGAVITGGVVIAVVASAETLLCATAVDQMHTGPRTRYNRELLAQGVGNTLCGCVGALPMTGVIVRSAANVQAGATTRKSAIIHGFWLLAFVAVMPFVLRLIPTSALAAMLVYTGYRLMNFGKLRELFEISRSEGIIFLVTVGMIVATDLLTGVLIGFGLSAFILLKRFSKVRVNLEHDIATRRSTMSLDGAATFLAIPKIAEALEAVPAGQTLHVDTSQLRFMDHASHEMLVQWGIQHRATGGGLDIDWEALEASRRM